MPHQEAFIIFWEQVKQSIQKGNFAKLTMAKTIGKLELKNIFVRPIYSDDDFKVLVKLHYRPREAEDEEQELSLEEAFTFLKQYLPKPFISVILFTTIEDVIFKINKKGVASITVNPPTFKNVV